MQDTSTVIGVFKDRGQAQQAVSELKRAGFREDQIGVTAPGDGDGDGHATRGKTETQGTHASQGAVAGLTAGAGVGALWGLGIVAGVVPAIGPAIAGGTLAAILSSAGAGAAAAGLAGTLIGFGIPEEEAEYYEGEFRSGRTIVSVHADGRESEARNILQRLGSYDMRSEGARTTGDGAAARNERTLQAREEELRVSKRPVRTGEVDVHKEVRTEHRTIDVPVQKEEVVVERRAGSGREASGPVGRDEHVRVPISEEQVSVEKRPVVKEEVTVGKRTSQSKERVGGNVRKEEIRVDKHDQSGAHAPRR